MEHGTALAACAVDAVVTAPNPLVAARQDSTTAISGIGIAAAVDIYNGISSGSWAGVAQLPG